MTDPIFQGYSFSFFFHIVCTILRFVSDQFSFPFFYVKLRSKAAKEKKMKRLTEREREGRNHVTFTCSSLGIFFFAFARSLSLFGALVLNDDANEKKEHI